MKTSITALLLAALIVPSVAMAHGQPPPQNQRNDGGAVDRRDDHRDNDHRDNDRRDNDRRDNDRRDNDRDDRFDRSDPRPEVIVVSRGHNDDVEAQIRAGSQRGLLTRHEADRLRAQNRDFEALKRRVYRDGRLSHGEAKQLAKADARLQESLRQQLRDGDRRGNVRTAVYVARPAPRC